MNQALLNLSSLFKNPHLRYPLAGIVALEVAKIWLPNFSQNLDATEKIITYYLIAAASNNPAAPTPTTTP
jgi:hypothetical protein